MFVSESRPATERRHGDVGHPRPHGPPDARPPVPSVQGTLRHLSRVQRHLCSVPSRDAGLDARCLLSRRCGAAPRRSARRTSRCRARRRTTPARGPSAPRPGRSGRTAGRSTSRHSSSVPGTTMERGATLSITPPARTWTRSHGSTGRPSSRTRKAYADIGSWTSGLCAGPDRRDQLGEAVPGGVVAHRDEHLARQARCPAGRGGPRSRPRRSRRAAAADAGQQPVADHDVPAVVGQLGAVEHERDRVGLRHDLARLVLADQDVLGEPVLDVAVEEPADRVVPHELRPRARHVPHRLGEVGTVGQDGDRELHAPILLAGAGRVTRVCSCPSSRPSSPSSVAASSPGCWPSRPRRWGSRCGCWPRRRASRPRRSSRTRSSATTATSRRCGRSPAGRRW